MTAPSRPLQFGIRHLLGAMFIVSLVAALIAPWVRGWSAGQWLTLGMQTAVVVATFLMYVAAHVSSRRRVRRQLGEIHFQVISKIWGDTVWQPASAYAKLAFATLILFLLTATTISGGKTESPVFYGVVAGILGAIGFVEVLDPPDQMFVGEHGVAIGTRPFLSWDQLWCCYEPGGLPAPILLKTTGWAFEVYAPAEVEQQLAEFVQERSKVWENPAPRRNQPRAGGAS